MRLNRPSFILFLVISLAQVSAFADVANTQETTTRSQNTLVNTSDVGNGQAWGLTATEWSHYQQLMQGPDGHYYPQLTPPEVLGIEAQSAQEQQHYAEIVAAEEHSKIAKELAFNNAVHDALLRLYPTEPVIRPFDMSAYNPVQSKQHNTMTLQRGDHLVLFINTTSGIDFLTLPQLLADIKKHPGVNLDIYCRGNPSDQDIINWAASNKIPTDLVQQGRITLNPDKGQLQKTLGNVPLPAVLLVRNGESKSIAIWSLS